MGTERGRECAKKESDATNAEQYEGSDPVSENPGQKCEGTETEPMEGADPDDVEV